MNENPLALIPELALLTGAVLGLLVGSWLPRRRQWVVRLLAAVSCVVGLVAAAVAVGTDPELVFGGSYAVDTATNAVRIIVLAATLLVICLSIETVGGHRRETEFSVLLLLGALGAIMLVHRTCCCSSPPICSPPSRSTRWPPLPKTPLAPRRR
ncbi:MAG: hypothetical protein ACRDSN_00225 [Pseudonocardiaceae bacterium]